MSEQMSWSDLYGDTPVQEVPLDAAGQKLLELIPEDRRAEFEPLCRAWLANIHVAIGTEQYAVFCADIERAFRLYEIGNPEGAEQLLGQYGISVAAINAMTNTGQ